MNQALRLALGMCTMWGNRAGGWRWRAAATALPALNRTPSSFGRAPVHFADSTPTVSPPEHCAPTRSFHEAYDGSGRVLPQLTAPSTTTTTSLSISFREEGNSTDVRPQFTARTRFASSPPALWKTCENPPCSKHQQSGNGLHEMSGSALALWAPDGCTLPEPIRGQRPAAPDAGLPGTVVDRVLRLCLAATSQGVGVVSPSGAIARDRSLQGGSNRVQ